MELDEIVPIFEVLPLLWRPASDRAHRHILGQCADCGATSTPAPSMERVAVRWNKRKGDDFGG